MTSEPRAAASAAEGPFADDVRLMQRVAAGDARAQRLLAHRLADRGLRVALTFVSHRQDAEDVVQDGLFEILKGAASYRGEAPLEGWADRIFVRRSMRYVRRTKQRRERWETLVEPDRIPAPSDDGPPAPDLEPFIDALDPKLQRALRLRFSMGYTVAQVAEVLGAPESTVKKQILRAVARVRAAWSAGGERS